MKRLLYPLSLLSILLYLLGSGWNDYDVSLADGYYLLRTNADTIMIYHTTDNGLVFVVPPKIVELNCSSSLIYGRAEKSQSPDIPSCPGFFILDIESDFRKVGLDKDSWLGYLRKFGIKREPSLRPPNRYFMLRQELTRAIGMILISLILVAFLVTWIKRRNELKNSA